MSTLALALLLLVAPTPQQTRLAFYTVPPSDCASIFFEHLSDDQSMHRGRHVYVADLDGETLLGLRDLTAAWGDGAAIQSVSVSHDGQRLIVSAKAPGEPRCQVYEVAGLGPTDKPTVTRFPFQSAGWNNVYPAYGSAGSVWWLSDQTRYAAGHPGRDEYDLIECMASLWRWAPGDAEPEVVKYLASGAQGIAIDSYGRVIVSQMDALRDDAFALPEYAPFNLSDESDPLSPRLSGLTAFPGPLTVPPGGAEWPWKLNAWNLWELRQDGSGDQTVNHVGRHETAALIDPGWVVPQTGMVQVVTGNVLALGDMRDFSLSPWPGFALFTNNHDATSAYGFGGLVRADLSPDIPASQVQYVALTDPWQAQTLAHDADIGAHPGLWRNPVELSDGRLVAIHTEDPRAVFKGGQLPGDPYEAAQGRSQRARFLEYDPATHFYRPGAFALPEIVGTGYVGGVQYVGPMWQRGLVEVRARAEPPATSEPPLEAPERAAFALAAAGTGMSAAQLERRVRAWLRQTDRAILTVRNVTTADAAERAQWPNRRVPGGVETIANPAWATADVSALELFSAERVRGYAQPKTPSLAYGLRVMAVRADLAALGNPVPPGASTVPVEPDGSVAAFVRATRQSTYQLLGPDGSPRVRERYWIHLRRGEIRACTSCHGPNETVQDGGPPPENVPASLVRLLRHWVAEVDKGGQAIWKEKVR